MSVYLVACNKSDDNTLSQLNNFIYKCADDEQGNQCNVIPIGSSTFLLTSKEDLNYLLSELEKISNCNAIVIQLNDIKTIESTKIVGIQGNGSLVNWTTLVPWLLKNLPYYS